MKKRFYTLKDAFRLATNAGAAAACAVGTYSISNSWTMAASAGLAVGIMNFSIKHARDVFENELEEHPSEHLHSPNLKYIVDSLYKASGTQEQQYPIYDFKPRTLTADEEDEMPPMRKVMREMMFKSSHLPNAAALNITKPVIIISEPLLELLDDEEEHAVLAHEFVHALANHTKLSTTYATFSVVAKLSNTFTRLGEYFSSGWKAVLTSIGSSLGSAIAVAAAMRKDPASMISSPSEEKKMKKIVGATSNVVGTGVMTAFNPAYLKLYAAVMGMNQSLNLIAKKLSRDLERQADRAAVRKLSANPLKLITALRKIELLMERTQRQVFGDEVVDKKKARGPLSKLWTVLNSTHPETRERIERLSKLAVKAGFSQDDIKEAATGDIDISDAPDVPYDVIEAIARQFHVENHLSAA